MCLFGRFQKSQLQEAQNNATEIVVQIGKLKYAFQL
jgi:hypothetical protein